LPPAKPISQMPTNPYLEKVRCVPLAPRAVFSKPDDVESKKESSNSTPILFAPAVGHPIPFFLRTK
jgi:hypothetical protein